MTSSLVGSEMCIRDRCNYITQTHVPHARYGGYCFYVLAFDNARLCTARPVSYTHLTLPTICSV
eukprot:3240757-Prorocentrum_lima.AAC.1